jgi:hypothetical protein
MLHSTLRGVANDNDAGCDQDFQPSSVFLRSELSPNADDGVGDHHQTEERIDRVSDDVSARAAAEQTHVSCLSTQPIAMLGRSYRDKSGCPLGQCPSP